MEKQEELDWLKNRLFLILDYVAITPEYVKSTKDFDSVKEYQRLKEEVEKLYQGNKLSRLRQYNRDFSEFIEDDEACLLLLQEKLGDSPLWYRQEIEKTLKKVKKRGKISNEEEYRMVNEEIDRLMFSQEYENEIKRYNELLHDFSKTI
ncbi:hypothetical protein QNI16_31340 [Cytophagaceae bacterium YF14B1]|uniref:Uncharacterized protein n=1 Tax=Xanthocytophaga flava TaxID=3048013 RepID=A0AAE3QYD6_9BACT|nr:hypothetical protein [Xanthocytophaga flavus]MDJ1485034.1 hypothetical protein [Xanthocytophaga flavus]